MQVAKQLAAINERINTLEAYGFKCKMYHLHDNVWYSEETGHVADHITIFVISWRSEEYVGCAMCSVSDTFSPATGAQIAFGRAITQMTADFGREFMVDMFNDY